MKTATRARGGVHLEALHLADEIGGVRIFERTTTTAPYGDIIQSELGSLARFEAPPLAEALAARPSKATASRANAEIRYLRDDGTERSVRGVLVHDGSSAAVLDFVSNRVIPAGDGVISSLARRLHGLPIESARTEVQLTISDEEVDPRSVHPYMQNALRARRRAGAERAILESEDFEVEFSATLATPDAFLRSAPLWNVPVSAIVAPIAVAVRNEEIPRFACVLPTAVDGEAHYLLHDGRSTRWLRGLGDVDPDLVAAFERSGALVRLAGTRAAIDFLPASHLAARCFVRVPPRTELAKELVRPKRPRAAALRAPGFAIDSHTPLELTGKETVIDDPAAAAFVLSHVVKGIYLPDDPHGVTFDAKQLPEEPAWLLLADARL